MAQAAGTPIPRDADPAPPAAHSYNDLVGKIKKAEPVGPSRPRERSPRRGDRRPIEVQRREEAKVRRGGGVLFPGGDGREEAIAMRSKTIPKETPKKGKTQEYYIGELAGKRKRVSNRFDREEIGRRGMPNPAPGNNSKRTGQKRKESLVPETPQPNRKPPPKPAGRLNARKVTFTGVREVQIPAVPGANRKPPRAASVQSGAPLPPSNKGGNTKKKK